MQHTQCPWWFFYDCCLRERHHGMKCENIWHHLKHEMRDNLMRWKIEDWGWDNERLGGFLPVHTSRVHRPTSMYLACQVLYLVVLNVVSSYHIKTIYEYVRIHTCLSPRIKDYGDIVILLLVVETAAVPGGVSQGCCCRLLLYDPSIAISGTFYCSRINSSLQCSPCSQDRLQ